MSKNFIHFLSDVPCILNVNGKNIGNIDNINNFELDIIASNIVYITYQPITNKNNFIPYTFAINNNNILDTSTDYIKVIPFPDNHYDIILKPFNYYQIENNQSILQQSIGKFSINIYNSNCSNINIFENEKLVFSNNTIKLKQAKAEIKNNYIIIKGIVDNDNYYLLVIKTKDYSIVYNDITQSIDDTTEYIQSYKKLNTLSHHAEIYKIEYNNEKEEKYYVYENDYAQIPNNPMLIPYSLLEGIKIGDTSIVHNFMHTQLANTPLEHFKNYFGNIQAIYLNRHTNCIDKYNYTLYNGKYKNYNFILDNNKITDIEEIF